MSDNNNNVEYNNYLKMQQYQGKLLLKNNASFQGNTLYSNYYKFNRPGITYDWFNICLF